jgi:hypothetical protein
MPKTRKPAKPRKRPNHRPPPIPSLAAWLAGELGPFFRRPRGPLPRSADHLRNAAIEVLEAMRVCLDETIARLKADDAPRLKRIRVEE